VELFDTDEVAAPAGAGDADRATKQQEHGIRTD
jgi:hypothetical protein